jgi:gas vesicle protein
VQGAKIIKERFRKVWRAWKRYKQKKSMDDIFALVENFDKGEEYQKWLEKQKPREKTRLEDIREDDEEDQSTPFKSQPRKEFTTG